jgi:hypothetical protein
VEISIAIALGKRWRKMGPDEQDIQVMISNGKLPTCKII